MYKLDNDIVSPFSTQPRRTFMFTFTFTLIALTIARIVVVRRAILSRLWMMLQRQRHCLDVNGGARCRHVGQSLLFSTWLLHSTLYECRSNNSSASKRRVNALS